MKDRINKEGSDRVEDIQADAASWRGKSVGSISSGVGSVVDKYSVTGTRFQGCSRRARSSLPLHPLMFCLFRFADGFDEFRNVTLDRFSSNNFDLLKGMKLDIVIIA